MSQAPAGRETGWQWALRVFGLRGRGTRKPPSKKALWICGLLSLLGVVLIVVSNVHGLVNDLGVGMAGGFGGGLLRGVWERDIAGRGDPH